jgi:hypothetical protein
VYTFILLRKTCILARLKDKWQRTRDEEKRSGIRRTMDRNNGATEKGTLWQFIGVRGRIKEDGRQETDHMREGTEYRRKGTETLNRGQRTEDRRQGTEMYNWGQQTGDKE